MRFFGVSVSALLMSALVVFAQGPAQADLDPILLRWEKAMTELQSFYAEVERSTKDNVFKTNDVFKGYAFLRKTDNKDTPVQIKMNLVKTTNQDVFERFVCTGPDLYEYVPAKQVVRVHKLPKNQQGALQQDTVLSLLVGMSAADLKKRYDLDPDPKAKADGYHYLWIRPKQPGDKQEFAIAQLVLYRANHLPARIWYQKQGGQEITWSFTDVRTGVALTPKHFEPELPNKNWRFESVKAP